MNTNLLNIVNRIVAEQGEGILTDAKRLFPYFSDYAKNEHKEERAAFGRCIEYGAYQVLRNTRSPDERQRVKATLTDQINAKTGVDRKRCADALDLLEMVIFKTVQQSAPAAKAGMQTSQQESPKPGTPVIPNNTFSQTQQPVNLTTGCQGCLLNGGKKCTYYDCIISEAEKYDCGMRGAPELQKKQTNSKIIRNIVIIALFLLVLFLFKPIESISEALGVNYWIVYICFFVVVVAIEHFIYQNIYKKRRENAKRL